MNSCKFLETTPDIALHGIKASSNPNNQENMQPTQAISQIPGPFQQGQIQLPPSGPPQPNILPGEHVPLSTDPSAQMLEQYTPPGDAVPEQLVQLSAVQPVHLSESELMLQQFSAAEQEDEMPAGLESYTHTLGDLANSDDMRMTPTEPGKVSPEATPDLRLSALQSGNSGAKQQRTPTGPRLPSTPLDNSLVMRERTISPGAFEGQYKGSDDEVLAAWIGELLGEAPLLPLQVHGTFFDLLGPVRGWHTLQQLKLYTSQHLEAKAVDSPRIWFTHENRRAQSWNILKQKQTTRQIIFEF
jgi:hypothetical protein